MRCHSAFRKSPGKVKTKGKMVSPHLCSKCPQKLTTDLSAEMSFTWDPSTVCFLGKRWWQKSNRKFWWIVHIWRCMRTYCTCQLEVETFVFFTGSFTERGLWGTFLRKILLESQWSDITIPHIMPGKSRLLLVMKGEREACSVNRELEPRFSGCHPDVSQYKWAHLIFPVNFILESSQWA